MAQVSTGSHSTAGGSRRGADRRAQLLDAAVRVIADVGARSMRVEEVAREAGVSTPLVYYYFDSRTDLLAEAFRHANMQMLGSHVTDASLDGRQRVTAYLLHEVEASETTQMWAFWTELAAAAVFDESLRAPINEGYEAWSGEVAALIGAGQRAGSIDPAPETPLGAHQLPPPIDGLGTPPVL
jgi:AcrR family transcriptional regulator